VSCQEISTRCCPVDYHRHWLYCLKLSESLTDYITIPVIPTPTHYDSQWSSWFLTSCDC
jgi:hypothetical protein